MSRDGWARYAREGTPHYDVVEAGFKYNMMDIQAAIGLQQLARFDALQDRRAAIWRAYDEALAALPVTRPLPPAPHTVHARHLYTILVDKDVCGWTRDELFAALRARGIGTSVHFRALHLHPYLRALRLSPRHVPARRVHLGLARCRCRCRRRCGTKT